ncbi:hypothetical protein CAPTEDRAFT_193962 [Capitella teleta]|uniref:Uncharacterized protein n=1 Tax=Capitella teleta TaxID=283909 RepID=R7UTN5_CAPTE|nr:hypothetical protein CAPTEDRAFT_193962 [Capitella teleta]|eukprot:ELU06756.1 hypothetical protein CAPTEDRAFT_193962 [Capitella teleta]
MSKMHLDEFNPLDVLAAAATLQQTKTPGSEEEEEEDIAQQHALTTTDQLTADDDAAPKDKAPLRMPPRGGGQSADHSYAWSGSTALLQKAESTEDDGYCSRCSLDSPGQSSRSDVDTNDQDVFSDTDPRSPSAPPPPAPAFKSPVLPPLSPKSRRSKQQQAKIVILSRDSNLKHLLTCPADAQNPISNNNNNSACQEFAADEHFVSDKAPSSAEEAPQPKPPVHTVMEHVDSWAGCPDGDQQTGEASPPEAPVVEEEVHPESLAECPKEAEEPASLPEAPCKDCDNAPVEVASPSEPKEAEEEVAPPVSDSEAPPLSSSTAVASSGNTIFIVRPVPSSSTENNRYLLHDDPLVSPSPALPPSAPTAAPSSVASWQLLSTLDSKGGALVARPAQPSSLLLTDKKSAAPGKQLCSLLKTADSPRKHQDYPPLLLVKQEEAGLHDDRGSPSPMLSSAPIIPTLNSETDKSCDSGKINIKISGSKVMDVSCADDRSMGVKRQATSIGRLGSLSWQSLVDSEPPSQHVSRSATSSPFLRTDTSLPSSPLAPCTMQPSQQQQQKRSYQRKNAGLKRSASVAGLSSLEGEAAKASCHTYVKKRKGGGKAWNPLSPTQHELSQMKLSAQSMLRLHPLIDHDYCMFSEFSAEIQSSIIATTETKLRTERKHGGKKAARTNKKLTTTTPGTLSAEKQVKRKYTKRKLNKGSALQAALKQELKQEEEGEVLEEEEEEEDRAKAPAVLKVRKRLLHEKKLACKYSPYKERPDKNYVKIPGSYQDDFVYYATRKSHKRIRKSPEMPLELPSKSTPKAASSQVGGINVFDWYREMAKVDKSKFGFSVSDKAFEEKALMSADKGNMMLNHAPPPEAEVLDFVINMDSTASSSAATVEKVETVETSEDIDLMAEQVRSMLNSMNETDLRLLSENLGDAPTMLEQGQGVASAANPPLLGDLDDINDSDLISSDIGNDLNMMLGELPTAAAAVHPPRPAPAAPSPTIPAVSSSNSIASVSAENAVPELTMVNMYWNDLPGLLIDGAEHVRLVDIHKQVLPAKDTGILKKRCQMMGLPILNCSELQRDFLVRYMNAAKSKSCVITSKECAKTLIGFYVDPRPRAAPSRGLSDAEVDEPLEKPPPVEKAKKKQRSVASPAPPAVTSSVDSQEQQKRRDDSLLVDESQDEKVVLDVEASPVAAPSQPPEKKVARLSSSISSSAASSLAAGSPPSPSDLKRSSRLRGARKVSYAAMHNGSIDEDLDSSANSVDETPTSSPASSASVTVQLKVQQQQQRSLADSPDEMEIRRLVNKRKKRALSKREASRLLVLRERVKKRRNKQKENLRVRLNKAKLKAKVLHESQPADGPAANGVEHGYASWHAKLGAQSQRGTPKPKGHVTKTTPVLLVTHRDDRQGTHRGKAAQDGQLMLDLFLTKEAACIVCSACKERMSVKKFLKHAHRLSNPDELVAVAMPQKLQLTSGEPSSDEEALWAQYLARCQRFGLRRDKEEQRKRTPEKKPSCSDHPTSLSTTPLYGSPPPSDVKSSPDSVEDPSNKRQSTRLRRRKQMHPMESYVFEAKRDRAEL